MSVSIQALIEFLDSKGIEATFTPKEALPKITQIASLLKAQSHEITFFVDPKRKAELKATKAGVVILRPEFAELTQAITLQVADPYYVYALIAQYLNPKKSVPGIHPKAIVADSAKISDSATIEAGAFIGENVVIEAQVHIFPNVTIEEGVTIGEQTIIGPNVTLMKEVVIGAQVTIEAGTVIGGDGFGWAPHQGQWEKIPQIGRVIIEDYVSIGNNCTIDRGAIEDTIIHQGTIIDNLVHIAHNVEIGEYTAIAGQVGFSGSTTVGKHCIFAGQAGVAGHLQLSDHSVFMAKSGITHSIKAPGSYSGFPAIKTSDWQKMMVMQKKLVQTHQQLKALQKEVVALKQMEKE